MSRTNQSFEVNLEEYRVRLLAGISVSERRVNAAGIPTAVLEGGDGPPVVLLHGPGESAVNWRWTIPDLLTTHRVVAPTYRPTAPRDRGTHRWMPTARWRGSEP